jgi:4-hydroxybenzoate polyprenyltransferase
MNIPLGKWSGSDATDALHASIKEFNAQSGRQTKQMLRLTWVMAVLTAVMLLGLVIQIYLVFYPPVLPINTTAQSLPAVDLEKRTGAASNAKAASAAMR